MLREEEVTKLAAVRSLDRKDRWLAKFNDNDELIIDEGEDDVDTGCYQFPIPKLYRKNGSHPWAGAYHMAVT
jgi:hypothetical protein